MASVVNDPGRRKRILFVAPDESRKAIRLGKCDRKSADAIARHVEALLSTKLGGQPVPRDTAAWLAGIGTKLRDKLGAAGLVEPLQRLTVREFLTGWLAGKKAAGHKPTSLRAWGQTADALMEQFGERPLPTLIHADGEAFRSAMQGRGLRATTIHKRLGHCRQMLEDAARSGHVPVSTRRPKGASTFSRRAGDSAPIATTVGRARICGPRSPRSFAGPAWNLGRAYGIRCGHRANPIWPRVSRWLRSRNGLAIHLPWPCGIMSILPKRHSIGPWNGGLRKLAAQKAAHFWRKIKRSR